MFDCLSKKFRSAASAALAGVMGIAASPAIATAGEIPFGVYDPEGAFADSGDVQIEHLFLPWEDVFLPSLVEADTYAQERGRVLLVTIEPWTWTRDERNTPQYLINGIKRGEYDDNMRAICDVLNTLDTPVTVRWAQEMDDDSGQFIWANWEPSTYIDAYRHMVDICRASAPGLNYMWSPIGSERLSEYYPGDDYVDLVGLSVFGLQPWEQEVYGRARTLKETLREKYNRVVDFRKPIVIAEIGFVGNREYVESWQSSFSGLVAEFPSLTGIVYFHQPEVYPWPDGFGKPDWRYTGRVLTQ